MEMSFQENSRAKTKFEQKTQLPLSNSVRFEPEVDYLTLLIAFMNGFIFPSNLIFERLIGHPT